MCHRPVCLSARSGCGCPAALAESWEIAQRLQPYSTISGEQARGHPWKQAANQWLTQQHTFITQSINSAYFVPHCFGVPRQTVVLLQLPTHVRTLTYPPAESCSTGGAPEVVGWRRNSTCVCLFGLFLSFLVHVSYVLPNTHCNACGHTNAHRASEAQKTKSRPVNG